MPDTLPLTHLVLYKHGVGTFTRQGIVDGGQLVVPFRAEEVDDALKSLTIRTLEGGQVIGIHYDTPIDRGEIPFNLSDRHSLFDLLRDLRGVAVTLTLDDQRAVSGRIVGVQDYPLGHKRGAAVVLLTDIGTLQQATIETIAYLRLDDQRMAADVARYLDTSSATGSHRAVRIDLTLDTTQLEVSYTVPSPVWRVSYRLVGQTNDGERQALFQGWAIFDNRLGEDLEGVDVALVAGQPVSFRYDLTSSVIPPRRFVRDEARIAAGPIEFEGALQEQAASVTRSIHGRRAPMRAAGADGPEERARGMTLPSQDDPSYNFYSMDDNQLLRPDAVAEGRELDELFEYRLGRISVGAGESAMAPIAQHVSTYHRELLYNGAKHPDHPVVALRLRNEAGLTLERGPITITEDGQYRGEAMLPFTRQDAEIVLAYAVELGITVRAETVQSTSLAGLSLAGAYLNLQRHLTLATTYTLFNRTAQHETVTLERARHGDTELTDTAPPDEETGEHRRWRVTCAPQALTTFTVTERRLIEWRDEVMDQDLVALSRYLEERFLDEVTRHGLETILGLRQSIAGADEQLLMLHAEQVDLGVRQDRLRQNLTIISANEDEQEIRRRSAEMFRRTQDREDQIIAEIERVQAARSQAEAELHHELARLGEAE